MTRSWLAAASFAAGVGVVALASWLQANPVPAPPQYIPTYTSRYVGDGDPALREILQELRAIRKLLESRPAQQEPRPSSLKVVFGNHCNTCHQEGRAASKYIILTDKEGNLVPLSVTEKRAIVRVVRSGDMPKDHAIPEAEKAFIIEQLSP